MHNFKTLYRRSLVGHACLQFRCYASRKTHYQVLGVKKTATQQEIKNAYIQLSKKHHPDTAGSGSKQTFTEINEAYSVLSKPLSRKEYDNKLAFSAAQTASSSNYRPHHRPPGSGPASYPNDHYQQRKNERTYQSEESSTYSDFHRKRHAEMYAQSELYRKYYNFYGRHERERREAAEERNGYTANFIVLAGLLLALVISATRITVRMMLNADPHLQRSPSDEVKLKMDRETRERRRPIEIEKDITPPRA